MLALCHPAAAERRLALVIGNDHYQSVSSLKKAVNDANAVGEALLEIGFDKVLKFNDASRSTLDRAVREFIREIREGDTVFFYFAGHGVAVRGTNYLLPVDFPQVGQDDDEWLVVDEARSVSSILEAFQTRLPARVFMVIDACRNNPFPKVRGRSVGRSGGGLVSETAVADVFMLFSAGYGQQALDRLDDDDPDPNSVFTRAFVPILKQQGNSQVDLAKKLQASVSELARTVRHRQNPAYYDQIMGLYYLNGIADPAASTASAPAAADGGPGPESGAAADWRLVENATDPAVIAAFREKYRDDPLYRALADQLLKQLAGAATAAPQDPAQADASTAPETTDVAALNPAMRHLPEPDRRYATCHRASFKAAAGQICVTSILQPQYGNRYGSQNLSDNAAGTAWVEGVGGVGVGEGILLRFDEPRALQRIGLVNGYAKNRDIYFKNARVRDLVITTSAGDSGRVTLHDTADWQWIEIPAGDDVQWVFVEIASVYRGNKYSDTAISEIRFE